MSKLIIKNLFDREVNFRTVNHSLLKVLQEDYIDLMHACGGKGRCTTCKVRVNSGFELLDKPSPFEVRCIENSVLIPEERLACQTKVVDISSGSNLVIEIPREYQLPHQKYSE